jgi:multidrug efflux pump subunit AcrA (membrane-fusion protein)
MGRGVRGDLPVREGDQLEPHETVGSIEFGEIDVAFGVESFGRIARLPFADGATVVPGQALFDYDERAPTMEEWQAESDRAAWAERRARDADEKLDGPWGALRAALKRRLP